MEQLYKVIYEFENLGIYGSIPGIKKAMQNELMRVYDMYAVKANSGVTDDLNAEFDQLYPNYHEDNKDKEWWDKTEYNQFIADGYQRLIVDKFNKTNVSPILDFFIEPEEIIFTGCLKVDHSVTIKFYMKAV